MKTCGVCEMCKKGLPGMCYDPEYDSYYDKGGTKTYSTSTLPSGVVGKKTTYKPCAHTHKPFKITESITVYGGAASDPIKADCDIYVSLDRGMESDSLSYPWNGKREFVYFPITDMSVPKNTVEFKKMIDWLASQAKAGKKIHIGCIGGHGRTGLVLAALTFVLTGDVGAIKAVRSGYCSKAVETESQMDFLHSEFGIKKEKGTKTFFEGTYSKGKKAKWDVGGAYESFKWKGNDIALPVTPMINKSNVWGLTK